VVSARELNDRFTNEYVQKTCRFLLNPLFEVKSPAESKGPWDLYKQRATIPAAEAFRPLAEGKCPLVK
jgi:hypothetical protein